MSAPILAALAAQQRRSNFLPLVLASLRGQVDRLHVYLNGWNETPACVRDLADEHVLNPANVGAERKLHWATTHGGVYLSCDDDIIYPPDYAATMTEAVEQWGGRAIVSAHGRVYKPQALHVSDVDTGSIGIFHHACNARWVNHAGTGCMAWDASKISVPTEWPESNAADMQLAIWAQQNRIPIWRVAHKSGWLKPLAVSDPFGLFRRSQKTGHVRRNELLRAHTSERGWSLYEAPTC